MPLYIFIIAAVITNSLFVLYIFFFYGTFAGNLLRILIPVIILAIINLALATTFIYSKYINPANISSHQSNAGDGFEVLAAHFAPSWFLRYTPAGIIDKFTSVPIVLSHNNLNPQIRITKETICYKVTKETCRPTSDITEITQTPGTIGIRYSFTFTQGDKLYLRVHNNLNDKFQQYLQERDLSVE